MSYFCNDDAVHLVLDFFAYVAMGGLNPPAREKKKNLASVCRVSLEGGSKCLGSLHASWKMFNPKQCLALMRHNTLPAVVVLCKGVS